MNNRIKQLRNSHNLSQEALGEIISISQQAVSKMETKSYTIYADLLIKMAQFFNVTTDYLLGISDIEQEETDLPDIDQDLEKCYDIVLRYQHLSDSNRQTFLEFLKGLEQSQLEEKGPGPKDVEE